MRNGKNYIPRKELERRARLLTYYTGEKDITKMSIQEWYDVVDKHWATVQRNLKLLKEKPC